MGALHEVVELGGSVGVVVVIDAAEANEHGVGGTELGQELAPPCHQTLVHGRQDPLSDHCLVQRYRRCHLVDPVDVDQQAGEGPDDTAVLVLAPIADDHSIPE